MSVTDISLRKRLGLELFRQHKNNSTKIHRLNYLFWECTLRCNLACKHCGSDCRKSMQQKDMPREDFLKVIDSITPHVDPNVTMIVLTGGEPLLRDDLEKCGKELYRRGYPWGMVSNGLAMTKEKLDSLLDSGLRSVTISLDGLEDTHNIMRGNKQSFMNAFNAIKLLVSKGDELIFDVVTCVTSETFSQLHDLKKLLIDNGVKRWRIFTVFPIGRATRYQELQLPPVQFKQLFDFIKETRKEGLINLSYGCEGFLGNYESDVRDNFFFCHAGVSIGSVLVDGSISACPNLRSNFVQGNIYQDDFMEVWNKRYQVFRDRSWTKQGECADCKYFRYCQGNGMHLRDEEGNLLFCHLKRIQEGEKQLQY
jgi:radical SAM additional 4Fe4S-binding domain